MYLMYIITMIRLLTWSEMNERFALDLLIVVINVKEVENSSNKVLPVGLHSLLKPQWDISKDITQTM